MALKSHSDSTPSTHTHVAHIEEFGVTVLFESAIVLFTLEVSRIEWHGLSVHH